MRAFAERVYGVPPEQVIGSRSKVKFEMVNGRATLMRDGAIEFIDDKAGKAIALAQTRTKRAKGHPTVPTMDEQGFAGFDATTWYGMVAPGRLPAAMVKRMNEDMNRVMAMPDVIEKFEQYGAEDGGGTPEKFAEFIRSEQQKWARVVKDAKVQVDA